MKPQTKQSRIDSWISRQKRGSRFYAKQVGIALNLTPSEVGNYLPKSERARLLGHPQDGPNWVVV